MAASMPQETIILQDKPAIVPILAIWPTMGIAMACPFIAFAITFGNILSFFTNIGIAIAITLFTICIIRMLIGLVRREVTTFTLTDKRIIFETGILGRDLDARAFPK
jgi:membrane protein YdbS with pleckstrin-like domain